MQQMTLTWRALPTNWWWKVALQWPCAHCVVCTQLLLPVSCLGQKVQMGVAIKADTLFNCHPPTSSCGNVAAILARDEHIQKDFIIFEAAPQERQGIPSKKPIADYFLCTLRPLPPSSSSGPWTTVTAHFFRQRLGKGTLFSARLSPQRGHFKGEDFLWRGSEPQQHAPLLLSPHLNHQVSNNFWFFSFLFVFT